MKMNLGELEINGVLFGRNTGIDEVINNPRFKSYVNNDGSFRSFTAEHVNVDEYEFNIRILFINNQIAKIELVPINLEIEDPGYPDENYQLTKKKMADSFLRKYLGNPPKEREDVLLYEFDWGTVSSVIFLSGRNEYTGGFIVFSYNQKITEDTKAR